MNREFFTSPTGQVVLVAAVLVLGVVTVRWQNSKRTLPPLPAAKPAPAVVLPKTVTREGARFNLPPTAIAPALSPREEVAPGQVPTAPKGAVMPLVLYAAATVPVEAVAAAAAPFGRLIPCETVVALESNRLDTPVIGIVTEDVWHAGQLIIPAGAEVHARAALDRTRERLAVSGSWRIVWRTRDARNGGELAVSGLALDRDRDSASGEWGPQDGSAGLRGQLVKATDDHELKLFAATFIGAATAALQDTRVTSGLLGEASMPVATGRNAVLGGTGAVLREYAQAMREAISRDGFYLRVPAGKAFYLYVTETLNLAALSHPPTAPSRL